MSIKTSEVSLHQHTYRQVTNIHIKHVPYNSNQKWFHPMAGSRIIWHSCANLLGLFISDLHW